MFIRWNPALNKIFCSICENNTMTAENVFALNGSCNNSEIKLYITFLYKENCIVKWIMFYSDDKNHICLCTVYHL